MRSLAILLTLVVFSPTAIAQIEITSKRAFVLDGIVAMQSIDGITLVGETSKPSLTEVAIVSVVSPFETTIVKARRSLYETAAMKQLSATDYLLRGSGEYAVEVTGFGGGSSDLAIAKVVIGASPPSPTPPEPSPPNPFPPKPDPPTPTPDPVPDVANDYNVGSVAIANAPKDREGARTIAKFYSDGAAKLYGAPSLLNIEAILKEIDSRFAMKSCTSREACEAWSKWKLKLGDAMTAEQVRRKRFTRDDWYNMLTEIVKALEAVK